MAWDLPWRLSRVQGLDLRLRTLPMEPWCLAPALLATAQASAQAHRRCGRGQQRHSPAHQARRWCIHPQHRPERPSLPSPGGRRCRTRSGRPRRQDRRRPCSATPCGSLSPPAATKSCLSATRLSSACVCIRIWTRATGRSRRRIECEVASVVGVRERCNLWCFRFSSLVHHACNVFCL